MSSLAGIVVVLREPEGRGGQPERVRLGNGDFVVGGRKVDQRIQNAQAQIPVGQIEQVARMHGGLDGRDLGDVLAQHGADRVDADAPITLKYVKTAADCSTVPAWYYDVPPPGIPTKITLCPSACDPLLGSVTATVQALLLCAPRIN